MNFEEKYNGALERAKALCNDADTFTIYDITTIFPELEEEMIRKDIISYLRNEKIVKRYTSDIEIDKWIAWLEKQKPNTNKREIDDAYLQGMSDAKHEIEKQGEIDLEHYKDSENEKRKFVGYGFLKCKGDFLSFKEGETYWLEYVGKDNYNVRSDNLLGQTFHIKPVELYTVFRPTTWLEKQGEKNINHTEIKEKEKYKFEKTRNFYNRILDMVHKFRIENDLYSNYEH